MLKIPWTVCVMNNTSSDHLQTTHGCITHGTSDKDVCTKTIFFSDVIFNVKCKSIVIHTKNLYVDPVYVASEIKTIIIIISCYVQKIQQHKYFLLIQMIMYMHKRVKTTVPPICQKHLG